MDAKEKRKILFQELNRAWVPAFEDYPVYGCSSLVDELHGYRRTLRTFQKEINRKSLLEELDQDYIKQAFKRIDSLTKQVLDFANRARERHHRWVSGIKTQNNGPHRRGLSSVGRWRSGF